MTTGIDGPAPAFVDRLVTILNDGMLALMISVGHRTGLFDSMAGAPPLTSHELADRAGLNERYVREWLGAMTTGGIVDYDPKVRTFTLPDDRAAFLTRSAGLDNVGAACQSLALLGSVEADIVRCFREGGGVPYAAFGDFQRLMAEDSGAILDATLIDQVLPLVPGLVERLRGGIDVADVGCGSGHALNLMAEEFPASRFTGFDISEEGLAAGRREAGAKGLANVAFVARDAAALGEAATFDFITTFDAIHDQARPDLALAAIRCALRPDGAYLCVDIRASSQLDENVENPMGPFLYTVSTMHCMTVSLAQGGMGLGTVWGEQLARSMLTDAGFVRIDVRNIEGDVFNNYYVAVPA